MASPLDGTTVEIEGVVVGDFQTGAGLSGFFVQEEDTDIDADPATSEGIFVYDGATPAVDVNVGDLVRVAGEVDEYWDLTEITNVSAVLVCGAAPPATPANVTLPVAAVTDLERYEGMFVNFTQTLIATETYSQGHYGEVHLSVPNRLDTPTNVVLPGAAAIALQDLNDRSRIQMDDGTTAADPIPVPYIGAGGTLRLGDMLPSLTGCMSYAFEAYEVHPTVAPTFSRVNFRNATPMGVGGSFKVASFNVLNYFVTLDDSGPICGPVGGQDCRGADNAAEFTRQRDKIISALVAMDADVVGLIEIENHPTDAAIQDLVNGLNAVMGAGTYDYVPTGPIGDDAIKLGFIYKPGTTALSGAHAVLDELGGSGFPG